MTGIEDKVKVDAIIEQLNKSSMDASDIDKLIAVISRRKKEFFIGPDFGSSLFSAPTAGETVGPSSLDILMYGTYDIDRDVFAEWHICTYELSNKEYCGHRNIVSEYDPRNPPRCPGKDGDKAHPFTPNTNKKR
jgi:hypothetical protein